MAADSIGISQTIIQFARDWDWILAGAGVVLSYLAFRAATGAKKEAKAAGRVVKIQTTTMELAELQMKLRRIKESIQYWHARELHNEVSTRCRRFLAPFRNDQQLKTACDELFLAIDETNEMLNGVRPTSETIDDEESGDMGAVYFGTEAGFARITERIAEVIGLLENIGMEPRK